MKMRSLIVAYVVTVFFPVVVHAGAAVAKRGAGGGGAKKQSMPQLPPGYVVGPNGIQKVSQEHESPQQQAAENDQQEPVEVKDEVGLEQIIDALQSSAKSWELIINTQDKQIVVEEFIKKYSSQGISIRKPAGYYANFIDELSKGSPAMLEMSFDRVLQVVAVMEYDFDNGQNKDMLAQKILGPKFYETNKKRLMSAAGK